MHALLEDGLLARRGLPLGGDCLPQLLCVALELVDTCPTKRELHAGEVGPHKLAGEASFCNEVNSRLEKEETSCGGIA